MRELITFVVASLTALPTIAAEHALSWVEVLDPVVRASFVGGRCVVLVIGNSPPNQEKISQCEARMEDTSAIMSIRTGGVTMRGYSRRFHFQLAVPTAALSLEEVVFGAERTVI